MIKCEFYTLGYNKEKKLVATKVHGYKDAEGTLRLVPLGLEIGCYHDGREWFCVAFQNGAALSRGKTRTEALSKVYTSDMAERVRQYIKTDAYQETVALFNKKVAEAKETQI